MLPGLIAFTYLGALFQRDKICTNNYISQQFPKETNTRGSNTFYSFSHKFTELLLIKRNFCTITWRISCYDFKTILICWEIWKLMLLNVSIAHIQPRIYGFSYTVSLFGSSRSMETYFRGEELQYESHVITVRQSSSNLHIRKLKWHGCINKYVFISVLHLLTLSCRFRVVFGVGHISNKIEH